MFLEHQILKDCRIVVRMTEQQRDSMAMRGQMMVDLNGSRSAGVSIPRDPTSTVRSSDL